MTATASVIVPTHGRPEKLQRCLHALSMQRLPHNQSIEIIVAEDGAIATGPVEKSFEDGVTQLHMPRVGVAAARNAAMEIATGEWLLFINDDCNPEADWAATHIAAQSRIDGGAMIVGRTDWMDWRDPTVFDGLLRETSMIFFYDQMRDGESYGFRHFWTCNASVPAHVARAIGGFDERLRPCWYEDIEFAYRIERAGYGGVRYVDAARNVHDHRMSWRDYLNRERCLGQMAILLAEVNRDCFTCLFGDDGPAALCEEFEAWLTMDAGDHERIESQIGTWCSGPLPVDESWPLLRDAIHSAHRPIKRRWFRQGFVAGFRSRNASPKRSYLSAPSLDLK